MRIRTGLSAAVAVMMLGVAPGMAGEYKSYRFASSANYCPAGLVPTTVNGAICCGKPTESITYQQAMTHPVKRRYHRPHRVAARYDCPIGVKGCR